MSDKKEIQEPDLDTEEAKELGLNEQPKPTRKVSHPATPIPDNAEPSTNDKIKVEGLSNSKKSKQESDIILIHRE